jgi:type II secretory pathway component GspD/PulD (secretin)
LSPAKRNYDIITLTRADAFNVAEILDNFFKEEGKKNERRLPLWYRMEYGSDESSDDKSGRLSNRRSLKFLPDAETNSILVQGADAKQLQQINKLVDFYDKPATQKTESKRITEAIHLEHTKAKVVADAVKEVYRDLLSEKDKAFQGGNKQNERNFFFYDEGEGDGKSEGKAPRFKGLLSIGVDELSNTLIVSAPQFLYKDVRAMILDLDKAAEPTADVKVIQLGAGLRGPEIQSTLTDILNGKKSGGGASKAASSSDHDNSSNHNHGRRREG